MNIAKEITKEIFAGPSRDLLFDACKYCFAKNTVVEVEFHVACGYTTHPNDPGCACMEMPIHNIRIVSIEHEDGSGDSLNLAGFCKANPFLNNEGLKPYKFSAYYDCRTRKGTITFAER